MNMVALNILSSTILVTFAQMQLQSCRCKCTTKVIAGNAVPNLSLQMQRQSCRCKCSAKVVAENAVHFTKLGKTLVLATLFIVLQEAITACCIDNDKIPLC